MLYTRTVKKSAQKNIPMTKYVITNFIRLKQNTNNVQCFKIKVNYSCFRHIYQLMLTPISKSCDINQQHHVSIGTGCFLFDILQKIIYQ